MKHLVGKRCLIKYGYRYQEPLIEVVIVEVSPSENNVKVRNRGGCEHWEESGNIIVVEVLEEE